MRKIYDLKFLAVVSSVTLLLGLFSLLSYSRDNILFSILLAVLAVCGSLIVVGHLNASVYLQRAILRLLKRYGGRLEYDTLKDYFMKSAGVSSDRAYDIDELLPYLITKLEKRRLVQTINGVVKLVS